MGAGSKDLSVRLMEIDCDLHCGLQSMKLAIKDPTFYILKMAETVRRVQIDWNPNLHILNDE